MKLDHALIGNGVVLALIAPDGDVAWYCPPRFDAPSVFAGLLDPARGGHFRVAPIEPVVSVTQAYLPDTLVVRTTFTTATGRLQVDDLCPMDGTPRLVRVLRPLDGPLEVQVDYDPRPDYGRATHDDRLKLTGDLAPGAPTTLANAAALVLDYGDLPPIDALASVEATAKHWRGWLDGLRVGTDPIARRSALTLAALTWTPSGAMIAAATTSIPEAIGTPRTWDYRYSWIRDGAFAADALLQIGDLDAARRFLAFMRQAVGDSTPQPLYRIDGGRDITEQVLDHLAGFAGTRPVRIGNAAALQTQHDTHGQLVWLAWQIARAEGRIPSRDLQAWIWARVEAAAGVRGVPDAGIWEFRDRPGRYTFSHLWCWVALDRGARLAEQCGETRRAARWKALAADERKTILAAADRVGFFAQTLDGDDVDASSLAVAPLGLVPADDPRYVATITRCEDTLLVDGLMRRYVAEDDFGETTSTFSLCTLWWIEALALSGQRDRARAAYDAFVAFANPHGLFAEDIEPKSGAQLGNFPQAYTHIGLLAAARALGRSV